MAILHVYAQGVKFLICYQMLILILITKVSTCTCNWLFYCLLVAKSYIVLNEFNILTWQSHAINLTATKCALQSSETRWWLVLHVAKLVLLYLSLTQGYKTLDSCFNCECLSDDAHLGSLESALERNSPFFCVLPLPTCITSKHESIVITVSQ